MIPIVDLQQSGGTHSMVDALSTYGFVELAGHGVDASVIAEHRRVTDEFFALAPGIKAQYENADPIANRGYRPRGSEALAYSLGDDTPADIFESFNAGRDPGPFRSKLKQPTPWPDDQVAGFRAATIAAINAFATIAAQLDEVLGDALGMPDLPDISTTGPDMLASIDYRPAVDGSEPHLEGQMRMGAHTDYTSFTLLATDPVRGLQIVSPSGEWVDVVPTGGNLLMNVGDLLAIWTNDVWPSTLHRVIPMRLGADPVRRTAAFFHYPDLDVVVEPLPAFVGDGEPHYAPISVEDHELGKMGAPKTGELPTSPMTTGERDH